jgi:uroporphyrinogen-III decarboxylase
VYDALDYNLYKWPGHGVGEDSGYQYNEAEYMKADEYDLLIDDPSGYWARFYLPRVVGAFQPWAGLDPFTDLVEGPTVGPFFIPFGTPSVQDMLRKLVNAGNAAQEWDRNFTAMDARATARFGLPAFAGGVTKAPYDILGDTLRGTRGLMLDVFRRPDKVLEACERLVPLAIDWARRACDVNRHPFVFMPLHKGADGFLSDADFRRFYWPTLKKVIIGLVDEGLVPLCFAEGGYNERLEAIHDEEIPAGRMIWMFDATNMRQVKKHLGGFQCFGGNVPGALLTTGTARDMDDYVRRLIEDVAGDGGFILGSGIVIDEARPECVKQMIDAGLRYGAQV